MAPNPRRDEIQRYGTASRRMLAVMIALLPISELLEEWLLWAKWVSNPNCQEREGQDLIGFDEFDWVVREHPEYAWQVILAALEDPRLEPFLGILAAGPLEDILSYHGEAFIERVQAEAMANPRFAWLLGGVWQFLMPEKIWLCVQAVWDRREWDGIPKIDG